MTFRPKDPTILSDPNAQAWRRGELTGGPVMTPQPMTDLESLAQRIEQAEGPSRELDCWIENHLGLARFVDDCPDPHSESWLKKRVEPKPYTASLDAAMTLIPSGHIEPGEFVREALSGLNKRFSLHMMHWPLLTPFGEYLARYVTAAALRARATSQHLQEQSR